MKKRKINVRWHLRRLWDGRIVPVHRHHRMITIRANPRRDDFSHDRKDYGSGKKETKFKQHVWQFTSEPENETLRTYIDGTGVPKTKKTITPRSLNNFLSFFLYSRNPHFKEIYDSGGLFVGLVGVPTNLKTAKRDYDFNDKDKEKKPRGFDRKPAIKTTGNQIAPPPYGYNFVSYTATDDDIRLVPVIDKDLVTGTGAVDEDTREKLRRQLSMYMFWLDHNRNKLKTDYNKRMSRNWRGNIKLPNYVFVSEFTKNEIDQNAGQIPLSGITLVRRTKDTMIYRGQKIPVYDIVVGDPIPIGGKNMEVQKQQFLYRYPTVFSKYNKVTNDSIRSGRQDWVQREKVFQQDKYKKDFNSWVKQQRNFHRKLPKDLREELNRTKQLSIPIQYWEPSDFALYRSLIRMQTGIDKAKLEGLSPPPDPRDYGLSRHKRKQKRR